LSPEAHALAREQSSTSEPVCTLQGYSSSLNAPASWLRLDSIAQFNIVTTTSLKAELARLSRRPADMTGPRGRADNRPFSPWSSEWNRMHIRDAPALNAVLGQAKTRVRP
jgi:hypothetical protein